MGGRKIGIYKFNIIGGGISKRKLSIVSMAFIYVPIILFLFGFVKFILAVISTLCIGISAWSFVKDIGKKEDEYLPISAATVALSFAVCLMIGFLCGWGGYVTQSGDWNKANAVLRDLIERSWPVYYTNDGETSALSYYIAGYLFPAFIGKIFHSFRAAEIMVLFYYVVGLHLIVLNSLFFLKKSDGKNVVIFMVGMIFFCGALCLAQMVTSWFYPQINCIGETHFLSGDGLLLQYRSVFVALRWVPVQFIFPCLMGIVFLNYIECVKNYVWILLPTFLYSAFAFVGICAVAVGVAIFSVIQRKIRIKEIFSVSNIGMAICLGSIFVLYFWGNISGDKPDYTTFHLNNYGGGKLWGVYFIFCFFMFGVHALICWKRNRKSMVFYITVATLLLIPLGCMGVYNDWVMGCSIVPLFFMMLFAWEFIFNEEKQLCHKWIFVILLCIGAVYPNIEMASVEQESLLQYSSDGHLYGRSDGDITMEKYAYRDTDNEKGYQYYTYDLDEDIFYCYLARKKLED